MKTFKQFILESIEDEIGNDFIPVLKNNINGNVQLYQEGKYVYVEFSYIYGNTPYQISLETTELDMSDLYAKITKNKQSKQKSNPLKYINFSLFSCNGKKRDEIIQEGKDKNIKQKSLCTYKFFSYDQITKTLNDFIKTYKPVIEVF